MKLNRKRTNYYVGLDLSLTGTGVVVLDQNCEVVFVKTLKNKLRGEERLSYLQSVIRAVIAKYPLATYCVEGYAMGMRSGQSFSIGELGGVIKLLLWTRGKVFNLVTPTALKKFVTGKGKAEKDMVILNVYKKWGWEAADNNQADAYVLAQIAKEIDSPSDNLAKYQEEVIEVILNPPVKKGKKK